MTIGSVARNILLLLAAVALWATAGFGQTGIESGKRVALVIGNGAYDGIPYLENPPADATLIGARFEELGFEVILRTDLDRHGFIRTLSEFRAALEGSETGAFFYAGHGVQVDGKNYLLPIDSSLESAEFLSLEAIDLNLVTEVLNTASRTSLVFLDACRNNPFDATRGSDASTRGLARVSAERNTMISFAAAPGNVALDRVPGVTNNHSPFAISLARHLGTPGDSINRTMIKVRRDVLEVTNNRQVPWENSSLVDEVVLAAAPAETSGATDEDMWEWIKSTDDPLVLERFVDRFPGSRHVSDAQARMAALRAAEEAARLEAERLARQAEAEALAAEREAREAERRDQLLKAFYSEPDPPELFGTIRDCPDCPEMVELRGTELLFGTPDTIEKAQPDERPAKRIALGAPIAVALTETSQGQFNRFVRETGHTWPDACQITPLDDTLPVMGSRRRDTQQDDDLPVACVSWHDAKSYARWLSDKTGRRYRLMTEIEFEYLAEAFHFNMDMNQIFAGRSVCDMVNIADLGAPFSWRNYECSDALGHGVFPVRSLQPDEFGLYHLLGNVWEWMENCYEPTPEAAVERALTPDAANCSQRAIRGGGWSDPLTSLSTSNRNWEHPDFRSDAIGFRVVRLP
ncbi:Formylglycine-generating sulfatase enzyme [Maliponia aquimaris]|uniref:Formylglycine-generating sulfatase enzyme n=2 Tax=Maliponia aquimaris TaxID=1673631 RepID=A0A238L4P6_9RHOB|nr:Formylglycine-generating sulfatase enzyme [Maliponia aquimaris]